MFDCVSCSNSKDFDVSVKFLSSSSLKDSEYKLAKKKRINLSKMRKQDHSYDIGNSLRFIIICSKCGDDIKKARVMEKCNSCPSCDSDFAIISDYDFESDSFKLYLECDECGCNFERYTKPTSFVKKLYKYINNI
jgi:hypothetical protein